MDYSFFDSLFDATFIFDENREIIYCNESAATLCKSSVKRMTKKKKIFEFIKFDDEDLFTMPDGKKGLNEPAPFVEVNFVLKNQETGKVQITIYPFEGISNQRLWITILRDVTLEEVLHAKYHAQLEQKEVVINELKEARSKLQDYSKNLETMVEDRTQELKKANNMLNAIMNSLGQGFLIFDESGVCGNFYTKACEEILESTPKGMYISDILNVPEAEKATFDMWLKTLFNESLPFDSLKDLGPSNYKHSQNKHIILDYYPVREEDNSISQVVLVATDTTAEYEASRALEKERNNAKMILQMVTSKKYFTEYIQNLPEEINCILTKVKENNIDISQFFRVLHTLEGEAATYGLGGIWQTLRDAQEVIEPFKDSVNSNFKEVKFDFIKELSNIDKAYNKFLNENETIIEVLGINDEKKIEITYEIVNSLELYLIEKKVAPEIVTFCIETLIKESAIENFKYFDEVVQQVAEKLNKKVKPLLYKNDIKIFSEPYKVLFSTFIHAFRNAVDHGLEASEERQMMGKNEFGEISIDVQRVEHRNRPHIQFTVEDDGGGINHQIIRKKLEENGVDGVSEMTDNEVIQHIFSSGVSSKEEIGEFSGRGIGMNAIKEEATNLGGFAEVFSELGKGTKLVVLVPEISVSRKEVLEAAS